MKSVASILAVMALMGLAGCGSSGSVSTTDQAKKARSSMESDPIPEVVVQGLGTHQHLLTGIGDIYLEKTEMRDRGSEVWMGYTPGETAERCCLIAYGTPEQVNSLYFSAALPYADYPDASKYPAFLTRNLKIQESFVSNLFKGQVPEEMKSAIEWVKQNPGKLKSVTLLTMQVKLRYKDKSLVVEAR